MIHGIMTHGIMAHLSAFIPGIPILHGTAHTATGAGPIIRAGIITPGITIITDTAIGGATVIPTSMATSTTTDTGILGLLTGFQAAEELEAKPIVCILHAAVWAEMPPAVQNPQQLVGPTLTGLGSAMPVPGRMSTGRQVSVIAPRIKSTIQIVATKPLHAAV